jgi:hypothetical protein
MNPPEFKSLIAECILSVLNEADEMIPYDKSKLTSLVNTKGNYAIHYHGIDGDSIQKYDNLEDVARFLIGRDLGADYRRDGGLQSEYAQYTFQGFNWNDLLTGPPRDYNSKYKSHFINLPLKLRWEHRKIEQTGQYPPAYSDEWRAYEGGNKEYDYDGQIYLDWPYGNRERFYHPTVGGTNCKWLSTEKTLESAKKAVFDGIPIYRKWLEDNYGKT